MRALLIDDNAATVQSIELMLKSDGFNVYTTDLGEEGVDLAKTYDYDIILLDLSLADISGMEVLRQIRAAKIHTPILILTGRVEVAAKVAAFSSGADDYMTKPFHKDELVSRMRALIRRSKGHSQSKIVVGSLEVNLDERVVRVGGTPVRFTGKEWSMLQLLALRRDSTVTKGALLDYIYGGLDEPELKIIDVFMCKVRKKLAAAGLPEAIETVWGRGYCLRTPATPTTSIHEAAE